MSDQKNTILESLERIYMGAQESEDGQRSMVAPSPELNKKIRASLQKFKSSKSIPGVIKNLLTVRERPRVGYNDATIYPPSQFPSNTPQRIVRSAAASRSPMSGDLNVLVVLVDFEDEQFDGDHDVDHYETLFFSNGVMQRGSVRDYFDEVSAGQVNIVGQVVGPYRMPMNLSEYANGNSGTGSARPNARDLAEDAAAAAENDVDYSNYDNDSDGYVDAFIVLHAGRGAEVTGDVDDIWSHKWVLPSTYTSDEGTKVYAYMTVPEDARIGVCAHELGHLLFGWPDLYDTDGSSEGVGEFCLMGGGSWLGNGGDRPCHPSAWCKHDQQWVNVVNHTSNASITIEDVKQSNDVHRLWKNGAVGDEFFLVENRQQTGFDEFLPAEGLLIWHIDENIASNSDEVHPKVALEQADGHDHLSNGVNRGDGGDAWPGTSGSTKFNDTSNPDSRDYAGNKTCVAVENIPASAQSMTVKVKVKCGIAKTRIKDILDNNKGLRKELKDKELKEKELRKEKEMKEKDFKEKELAFDKDQVRDKSLIIDKNDLDDKSLLSDKIAEKPETDKLAGREKNFTEKLEDGKFIENDFRPFIDESLRPDLANSALSNEADVEETREKLRFAEREALAYFSQKSKGGR